MFLKFVCYLFVGFLASFEFAYSTTCVTPFGVLSKQMPLQDCPQLRQFIYKYGVNMTKQQFKFLSMSFIDFNKRIVCCDPNFDEERSFRSVGAEILRSESLICGDNTRKRIAFGNESTFLSHPWSVLLMYHLNNIFQCGGTLITRRYVLTAAHCIIPALYAVRLGEHKISTDIDCEYDEIGELHCASPVIDVGIDQVIKHPNYANVASGNDIALLRLDRYITYTRSVRTICIPEYQNQEFEQESGIISGWGITENGTQADVSMEAIVTIISLGSCKAVYPRLRFDNTKLCTRGNDGEETCDGDSGGPLLVRVEGFTGEVHRKFRYMQVGITSSGYSKCGSKRNFPAMYTKIAAYVEWIAFSIDI